MGAQARQPAGGRGLGERRARAQQLDELGGGAERVGDRAAALERHGGDDLAVELGDQHGADGARGAVELREARERRGVLGDGAAQDEALARRGDDRRGAAWAARKATAAA